MREYTQCFHSLPQADTETSPTSVKTLRLDNWRWGSYRGGGATAPPEATVVPLFWCVSESWKTSPPRGLKNHAIVLCRRIRRITEGLCIIFHLVRSQKGWPFRVGLCLPANQRAVVQFTGRAAWPYWAWGQTNSFSEPLGGWTVSCVYTETLASKVCKQPPPGPVFPRRRSEAPTIGCDRECFRLKSCHLC